MLWSGLLGSALGLVLSSAPAGDPGLTCSATSAASDSVQESTTSTTSTGETVTCSTEVVTRDGSSRCVARLEVRRGSEVLVREERVDEGRDGCAASISVRLP